MTKWETSNVLRPIILKLSKSMLRTYQRYITWQQSKRRWEEIDCLSAWRISIKRWTYKLRSMLRLTMAEVWCGTGCFSSNEVSLILLKRSNLIRTTLYTGTTVAAAIETWATWNPVCQISTWLLNWIPRILSFSVTEGKQTHTQISPMKTRKVHRSCWRLHLRAGSLRKWSFQSTCSEQLSILLCQDEHVR